jgi:hypothetical protein
LKLISKEKIMKNTKQSKLIIKIAIVFAVTIGIVSFNTNVFAVPPTNDNFVNAEVVSGIAVHLTRTNVDATKEVGEPNHANNTGGKSVWFKWTAPMSRTMSFTTNRSSTNIDTLLNVYTGSAVNSLSHVTANNSINPPANQRSFARTQINAGVTYFIAIDGSSNNGQAAEGSFLLDIQPSFEYQGADYDLDEMTDFSYFRPSGGTWNVFSSSTQQIINYRWGTNGDIPLVYSGNGAGNNEFTVFRPSSGIWYQTTCCPDNYTKWGTAGDIPVPANFGGGENTQIAVFRPSTGIWYIYYFEGTYAFYKFGQTGDIPVPGQYSPDEFADVAVFRPVNGTWYFMKRISNNPNQDSFSQIQFGQSGDKPVPADYDGDGILDAAVYRPSTGVWWVLRSSDNQVRAFQWGIAEDIPTTGDYDGDGKFDYAVFRPSTGFWYVFRSGDNAVQIKQFGQTGDIPVTANKTF